MTRQEILDSCYTIENGFITSPGKFECEPIYAPYFWDFANDGSGDDLNWSDGERGVLLDIEPEDRIAFPEIPADAVAVYLTENDQGFVSCDTFTEQEKTLLLQRYAEDEGESE